MNGSADPHRHSALQWVRGELDQSLGRARALIEQAHEQVYDTAVLPRATVELNQLRGTAAMIRCSGAQLLADEMLAALADLGARRPAAPDELYAALLGAVAQTGDYLQAVAERMDDCALLLQPAINELRLARGQPVLTEGELFAAQLALLELPLPPVEPMPEDGLLGLQARRFAPAFQASLLAWIRNAPDALPSAARLGKIAEQLAGHARRVDTRQLLRIAAAAIEALLSRGLDGSMDLKRLLGRVDQQIRLMGEQGEKAAVGLADLGAQLLFLIGRSQAKGPRVSALRLQYGLAALLPDPDELDARRRRLHGPDTRLLTRVAEEIRSDFLRVKDHIDLAVRAGGASADQFAATAAGLRRIADVLGSLGLVMLQQAVANQARTLENLGEQPGAALWLALAESILRVESSLDDALFRQLRPSTAPPLPELAEDTPTPRDVAEGLQALSRESLVNLARVKTIVGGFLRDGNTAELPDAALLIDELAAGCEIVERHRAADASRRLQRFIAGSAFAQMRSQPALAESFADAIAALEYYLESERDGSPLVELLADRIDTAVAAIEARTDARADTQADTHTQTAVSPALEVLALADIMPAAAPIEGAEVPAAPAAGDDVEIRAVFLEEAGEVLATLRETLASWTRDPHDRERLATLRRGFHTIKGSGRTVGADALGEFAWAIERLLNGVLDGSVAPSAGIVHLVDAAVAALPAEIAAFRDGGPASAEAQQLAARAQVYADGQDPDAASPQDIAAVFRDDASLRLGEVERWLAGLDRHLHRHLLPADIIRAFHTLRGAARVVEAPAISELAAALERWLEHLHGAGEPLDDAALTLLEAATHTLHRWCAQAGTPAVAHQDAQLWIEQIESLQGSIAALQVDDEVRRLAEIFAGEAFELIEKAEALLRDWAQSPDSDAPRSELQTLFHTLAGAAHMAGCPALGRAASALQRHLDAAQNLQHPPAAVAFSALHAVCESLYQQLDHYRDGRSDDGAALLAQIDALDWLASPAPEVVREAVEPLADVAEAASLAEIVAVAPPPDPPPDAWIDVPTAAFTPEIQPPAFSAPLDLLPPLSPQMHGLDAELLDIFAAEAEELLEAYARGVAALDGDAAPGAAIDALMRTLHTLKGSARVAGLVQMGDVAHRLETLIEQRAPGSLPDLALLRSAGIVLQGAVDDLRRGALPDLQALLDALGAAPTPPPLIAEQPDAPVTTLAVEAAPEFASSLLDSALPEWNPTPVDEALFVVAPADTAAIDFAIEPPADAYAPLQPLQPLPDETAAGDLRLDDGGWTTPLELPSEPLPGSLDDETVRSFALESRELFEQIEQAYARWQVLPGQTGAALEMQRALHTLKGGARSAGLLAIGDTAHELETRVAALLAADTVEAVMLAPLADAFDGLRGLLERAERGDLRGLLERLTVPLGLMASAVAPGSWDPELFWRPAEEDLGPIGLPRETARVPVELLDGMLGEAGEMSIHRARLEEQHSGMQTQLTEMAQAVVRVREQLRQLDIETEAQIAARGRSQLGGTDRYAGEFDPLELDRYTRMQELSRALSESVGDLGAIHGTLDALAQQSVTLLQQQARVNATIQQSLMGTLMVPFSRQTARLQRVAVQTAAEMHKQVEIVFSGIEAELDRKVLDRLTAPLEHLIRNAVVHGIETPELRLQRGKPALGEIQLRLWREGTQLRVELRDDGNGLDFDAIREAAVRRGLVPPQAPTLSDEAALPFIFMPGFSTARELTQSAGRGVGLDVVSAEVKQLGGSIDISSQSGAGARFTVRLPLNLALSQALLVTVGGETYAVPLASVEGIARLSREQIASGEDFPYGGSQYRVRYLGDFIGTEAALPPASEARMLHAILVHRGEGVSGGERRYAVIVDRLIGSREIISKAVGAQISSVPGVMSATILADGSAALVLDVAALAQDEVRRALRNFGEPPAGNVAPKQIMVVDDSLTIRRVTERLLQRHGYAVLTAKDGLDAMAQLQTHAPAAVLLDIEMPRADGFEVAAFIRNSARIAQTPILMITSRSGDKHRERAAGLGVDRYLIKPYQEDQLLAELRSVLRSA